MKSTNALGFALALLLILPFASLQASDTAKEKRWADQIVDALMDGEAVWLEAGKTKVLSLYTESASKPAKGAVIVLHGVGVHPDWADVVNPLRVKLTHRGWATLSVQMPILANDAQEKDYPPVFPGVAPRMQAAIDFLKSKGYKTIAVAGHSMGATMAAYYVANNANPVTGLVVVGASGLNFTEPKLRYFDNLPKLKLPVLDIYGSKDNDYVLASVTQRKEIAAKAGNTRYTQVKVEGANHFFRDKDAELVKEVGDWLDKNVAR